MNIHGRIQRLEKWAGIGERAGGVGAMTDSALVDVLRRHLRADPDRRWEEVFPDMGYFFSQMLAEARAADTPNQG